MGIARHKLLDHYRRQQRAGWAVVPWDDRDPDGAQAEDTLAAVALAAADGGERALAALAAVPSPQRESLVLRYLDGLPVDAVALALGRSVGAAESLLVRGRVAFRRAYLESRDDT
jgi:RNA polymerase sigma-70 factor (ECF subfamily)